MLDRREFDAVELGIMWDRLISIVDEIVSALIRTSYSLSVREVGDLSCVLFDATGRSLAQGSFSQPSFTGTAPLTMRHMLAAYPPHSLAPGDVLITNDPWIGTGHLFDVSVMRPAFRRDKLVGFTMSVTHLSDIGGSGFGTVATEVYEEGLYIPLTKIVAGGKLNDELVKIIRGNVRLPDEVMGDLMGHITCNQVGEKFLVEFMDEYHLDSLENLGIAITAQTERSIRGRIRDIPDGTYKNQIKAEGVGAPIDLACTVKVAGDSVHIDLTGTGPSVRRGINVPYCYSRAMALFSIKAITIPEIPNNEGATNPVTLVAPEGCILNTVRPFPTGGRHIIGHFVNPLIFGALKDALPDRVQAECGMLTQVNCQGRKANGDRVSTVYFAAGGYGAHRGLDGAPVTPGPGNMIGCPTEIFEHDTSIRVVRKALAPDSGGAGKFRGGVGQDVELLNTTGSDLVISGLAGRTEFAPRGLDGAGAGRLRQYRLNGEIIDAKGRYVMKPGDRLSLHEPGGGGVGDPMRRSADRVLEDVVEGLVSVDGARRDYGVAVDLSKYKAWRS